MERIEETTATFKRYIRDIPDFPKPGIIFKDVTPLLASGEVFPQVIESLAAAVEAAGLEPHTIASPEARGFILGSALACRLGLGFVPIRKPGKLPYKTVEVEYALEYGTDKVQMHVDALSPGERVLIVDDLLATGGTTEACRLLIEKSGGVPVGCAFLVELTFLDGRKKIPGVPVISLVEY